MLKVSRSCLESICFIIVPGHDILIFVENLTEAEMDRSMSQINNVKFPINQEGITKQNNQIY